MAGTILSKSTVIAKNVRSFFEINYPFESKHDRTQHHFNMTKNMTVISKSTEGIQSPSFEKGWALLISKSKYLYHIERKVNHHFEATVNHHFEATVNHHFEATVNHHFEATVNHHLEMKVDPSFRKENQSSSRNDSHRHFETRVHPSFRNDSAASFQNDSFVCDKSPINLK